MLCGILCVCVCVFALVCTIEDHGVHVFNSISACYLNSFFDNFLRVLLSFHISFHFCRNFVEFLFIRAYDSVLCVLFFPLWFEMPTSHVEPFVKLSILYKRCNDQVFMPLSHMFPLLKPLVHTHTYTYNVRKIVRLIFPCLYKINITSNAIGWRSY